MDLGNFPNLISINLGIALLSLGWLLVRLRKVLKTPVDDLVRILGLEVPVPPQASLLEISSTGAIVHWKSPEQRTGSLKFAVRINGITGKLLRVKGRRKKTLTYGTVGEVSHQESAVTISGLLPSHCYIVRIVVINQFNFSASSEAIRLRTLEGEPEDVAHASKPKESDELLEDAEPSVSLLSPTVIPYKAFAEQLAPIAIPPMSREHSNSNAQTKRSNGTRRGSHATHSRQRTVSVDHGDSVKITELTARLEAVRSVLQIQQIQDEEEEAEFQKTQKELVESRDDLRRQLKERDDQNKDLNKSVKSLEHANSAAQIRKSQQEKVFHDRLRVREKIGEDIARWNLETDEFETECGMLLERQRQLAGDTVTRVEQIRAEQQPDLEALVKIEERIQEKGREMQELDKEKKQLEDGFEDIDSSDRRGHMNAVEKVWTDNIAHLQAQLHEANLVLQQTRFAFQQAQQHLELLSGGRRGSLPNGLPQQILPDYEYATNGHHAMSHNLNPAASFEVQEQRQNQISVLNRHGTNSTNSLRTSSPFINHMSHIALPGRYQGPTTEENINALTGGALASPSANALIPSDLLGDDVSDDTEEMVKPRLRGESTGQVGSRPPSSLSRPLSTNYGRSGGQSGVEAETLSGLGTLPGLGDQDSLHPPISPPLSYGSASPSIVSSPHGSIANLHGHKPSESNIEVDRRSVRSASGSSRILPSSRRFELFGRSRGKTTLDEGPALGTLKQTQSQSMPREGDALSGSTSRSSPRPTGGLFGVLGRRSGGSEANVLSPVMTSRPASIYSLENALPHPSTDIPRFGWGISRGSPEKRKPRVNPWSPLAGRRTAKPYDSTSSLIQEMGGVDEDDSDSADGPETKQPAPIGTKPSKEKSRAAQLNPAALDFTSILSFGKKGERSEKAISKSKKRDVSPGAVAADALMEPASPSTSRRSRDTQLDSPTASSEDLTEETDSTTAEAQENTQPNPTSRGSLIRRITRKGSTALGQNLFSRKAANLPQEDGDEEAASPKLSRSVESIGNNVIPPPAADKRSSAFSLSSLKRRSKKANEAPSISETSMASETGDEEDGVVEDGASV